MQQLFQCILGAALASSSLAHAADLTVDVVGLNNARGKVMLAVYDSADTFLNKPMRVAEVAAQPGKVQLHIAGLAPGEYAVSVFQDENGNGKLDRNPLGMPIEPYGFSNDAAANYGPPSFQQSRAQLPASGKLVTVNLR